MPTRPRRVREAMGRAPTAAEIARRREIVDAAISLIAERGWDGASLQQVADEIGLSKAAVVYHVGTKGELVAEAYATVLAALTDRVVGRLAGARSRSDEPELYLRAQVEYFAEHPGHARVLAVAIDAAPETGLADRPESAERWTALAGMIAGARAEAGRAPDGAADRMLAILLDGALDGAVAARLADPGFPLDVASDELAAMLRARM